MLGTSLVLHRLLRREDGGSGGRTVKVPPPPTPAPTPNPPPTLSLSSFAPSGALPRPARRPLLCTQHTFQSPLPPRPHPLRCTHWLARQRTGRTDRREACRKAAAGCRGSWASASPPPAPVRCRPKDARSAWHAVGAQMAPPSSLRGPRPQLMAVLVGGGAGPAGAVRAPVCQERGPGPSAPSSPSPPRPPRSSPALSRILAVHVLGLPGSCRVLSPQASPRRSG